MQFQRGAPADRYDGAPISLGMHCSAVISQVLDGLAGDASLDKFRAEYEKLHDALKKVCAAQLRSQQ